MDVEIFGVGDIGDENVRGRGWGLLPLGQIHKNGLNQGINNCEKIIAALIVQTPFMCTSIWLYFIAVD